MADTTKRKCGDGDDRPVCPNCGNPDCPDANHEEGLISMLEGSGLGKDAALAIGNEALVMSRENAAALFGKIQPLMATGKTVDQRLAVAILSNYIAPFIASVVVSLTGGVPRFDPANHSEHEQHVLQGLSAIVSLIHSDAVRLVIKAGSGDSSVSSYTVDRDGKLVRVPREFIRHDAGGAKPTLH